MRRHPIELVSLDRDHPGFRDPSYRERRNAIAAIAQRYVPSDPVPDIDYTEEEQQVWRTVWAHLEPLHAEFCCRELLTLQRKIDLGASHIPQLSTVNRILAPSSGFRMEPVAGLVQARTFMEELAQGVFLSTQYIRHASRPFYTPEPDVVHELVGHAASLTHPRVAELNRLIGRAAAAANETEVRSLERLYWFVLEFGVVQEAQGVKAFGAGLLSSCGELKLIESGPALEDWSLDRIAATEYDPTDHQPRLFVAPSFERLIRDVETWIEGGHWRQSATDCA